MVRPSREEGIVYHPSRRMLFTSNGTVLGDFTALTRRGCNQTPQPLLSGFHCMAVGPLLNTRSFQQCLTFPKVVRPQAI